MTIYIKYNIDPNVKKKYRRKKVKRKKQAEMGNKQEKLTEQTQPEKRKEKQLNEQTESIKRQIEEKTIKTVRKNNYSFKRMFHAAFNLSADQASYEEISERIESGVELRGTNMCILILAIFIASVGLNMNSTAVIIGAMLVSPLMGAIMGIGFAIALYDTDLLKKSATVLLFEVIVALAASTIYFSLSPITTASSELLARTSPTAWDVIIAVCGGLAGMIGTTRKEKSNILPGVAIATALMPPLCTAGYGLAMGNLRYFAGAMYLFLINGIFIAISTMLITIFVGLPSKYKTDRESRRQIVKRAALIAVVAIVPSVFFAADIVRDTVFETNINNYMEKEFRFENTQVVKYSVNEENKELNVAVIGTTLDQNTISNLAQSMKDYHIDSLELKVQQTEVKAGITPAELEAYVKNETSQLSAENEADYQELQSQLIAAKSEISAYQEKEVDVAALQEELKVLYPVVTKLRAGYLNSDDTEELTVVMEVNEDLTQEEIEKITGYIETRLEVEGIVVYQSVKGILYPAGSKVPKDKKKTEGTKSEGNSKSSKETE